jgi:hypothetical protein
MSAVVRTEYTAYCAECADGSGWHDDEESAENWASEHDAEHHNEPDLDDENYDRMRDERNAEDVN